MTKETAKLLKKYLEHYEQQVELTKYGQKNAVKFSLSIYLKWAIFDYRTQIHKYIIENSKSTKIINKHKKQLQQMRELDVLVTSSTKEVFCIAY